MQVLKEGSVEMEILYLFILNRTHQAKDIHFFIQHNAHTVLYFCKKALNDPSTKKITEQLNAALLFQTVMCTVGASDWLLKVKREEVS